MKHTKGPWNVQVAEPCGPQCDAADYAFSIETDTGRNMPTGNEALANMALISAAPELLDACKQAHLQLTGTTWNMALSGNQTETANGLLVIQSLRRAIAKAERKNK